MIGGALPSSVFKVSFNVADTLIFKGLHTLEIGSLSQNDSLAWVWTYVVQLQPSTVNGALPVGYSPTDVAFQLYAHAPSPVPLPSALPLFATGLGVLGLLGWRRKRKASAAFA
jgi:PEP-CTERM motif-containing protein